MKKCRQCRQAIRELTNQYVEGGTWLSKKKRLTVIGVDVLMCGCGTKFIIPQQDSLLEQAHEVKQKSQTWRWYSHSRAWCLVTTRP